MKKFLILSLLAAILSLTACTSGTSQMTIDSNASDFDMNDFSSPEEVQIESGQCLYDANGLKITSDSIESDSLDTYLIISIENTSDTDLSLYCEGASVNHFILSSSFSLDLPAGASTLTGIPFSNTALNACEIHTITSFSFKLGIYDAQEYTFMYDTGWVDVPTNYSGSDTQTVNTNGTVIYDANDIQLIGKGFAVDEAWGDVIVMMILNQSDKDIHIGLKDGQANVNGNDYENTFYSEIPAGQNAIAYIYFQDEDSSNITELSSVTTAFTITDMSSWKIIDTTKDITFSQNTDSASDN